MKEPLFQALFFYNFPFIIIIIICCQAICFDMFKNDFHMYTCTSCFAQRISEGARARNYFPGVSPIFFILLTDVLSCVYMFEQLGKDEEPKQFLKEGEIKQRKDILACELMETVAINTVQSINWTCISNSGQDNALFRWSGPTHSKFP